MINIGRDIVILCKEENELRQATLNAIDDAKCLHETLHGEYRATPAQVKASSFGFLRLCEQHLHDRRIRDPRQTVALLMKGCLQSSRERSVGTLSDAFGVHVRVPAHQFGSLFRGVAAILLHLWKSGNVVLNPYFAPNLKNKELSRYRPKTLDDFVSYVTRSGRHTKADIWNVVHCGKRLFWASDWVTWDRFKPEDLAAIHARWLQAKQHARRGIKDNFPVPPLPFRILLQALRGDLAELVASERDALASYQQLLELALLHDGGQGRTLTDKVSADSIHYNWSSQPTIERDKEAILYYLRTIRQSLDDDRWPGATKPRRLWEDLPVRQCGAQWVALFDQYIEHWKERYESDTKYDHLRNFNDYLFLYLNWWHHRYGEDLWAFPSSPGDIRRFFHIKKGLGTNEEPSPLPYKEFLKLRTDSELQQASALRAAFDFFEWVTEEFSGTPEESRLFGSDFKNPIRPNDIHYKSGHNRVHARVRLNKRHAVLFADYLLAIEAFYCKVEEDAFTGMGPPLPMKPMPAVVDAEEFGFIPVVFANGKSVPIKQVPMLHQGHSAALCFDFSTSAKLPNLSVIRLLCFMVETGLRGAHIRWLDRKSFVCTEGSSTLPYQIVWVNTDKAGDAFSIPVSDEAFRILLRQHAAVKSVLGDACPEPVPYMDRAKSRFEDVNTLFYAPSSTQEKFAPVHDGGYRNIFRLALACYSLWLEHATGEEVDLVRKRDGSDLSTILDGSRSKAMKGIHSDHTPHSIRSTIISERISVLPIRLVGQLAGQRNEATTAYYHQVDEEYLHKVLNGLPMEPSASFGFRPDEPCYIQSGTSSSALSHALTANRTEAEIAFGLTSISLRRPCLDDGETGLQALRGAADSEISFFDTNLCPFSGRCPQDVLEEFGEPNRCGLCRYAVKSVDQLPAIQAKIHFLEERSRRLSKESEKLLNQGVRDEAQRLSDVADLDAAETIGWYLAEAVLEEKLEALRSGATDISTFHVDQPEILKRHLAKVSLPDSNAARLLLRISEANAYPSMQDEVVKQLASRLKRRIRVSEDPFFEYESDPVGELCSYLSTRMDVQGLTTEDVIHQLQSHQESITLRIDGDAHLKQLISTEE